MRKMQNVYQVVFVMNDGVELSWKIFDTIEKTEAFIKHVPDSHLQRLGIVRIAYRVRYIE